MHRSILIRPRSVGGVSSVSARDVVQSPFNRSPNRRHSSTVSRPRRSAAICSKSSSIAPTVALPLSEMLDFPWGSTTCSTALGGTLHGCDFLRALLQLCGTSHAPHIGVRRYSFNLLGVTRLIITTALIPTRCNRISDQGPGYIYNSRSISVFLERELDRWPKSLAVIVFLCGRQIVTVNPAA
jgi:hypothetical protein